MTRPFTETATTTSQKDATDMVTFFNLSGIPAWYATHGNPETYVVYTEDVEGKPF